MRNVYIDEPRDCQLCKDDTATYDAKTLAGPWAYMCEDCWECEGSYAGGSRLIVGEEPERTDSDIKSDLCAAIESGDFAAMEEALGDRDFAEFF